MKRFWGLRGPKLHAAIWAESCIAVAIFGYNQAAAGGVLTDPSFISQFPRMDVVNTTGAQKHYNSTIQGTVIALYTLTGGFGALACTFLGDIWGKDPEHASLVLFLFLATNVSGDDGSSSYPSRRGTIFVAALFNGIGALLMCTPFSFGQFIVSRIVLGLGTGGIIATVSVWQTELSKASSRGAHVAAFGIFCGVGLVLALWLDFGCSYASGSFSWRFPLAVPMLMSVIVMAFIFTLPESPRLLMKQGKVAEARGILEALHEDPETVEKEVADIQLALQLAGNLSESAALRSMFTMGPQKIFHRVVIAASVQIMLQLTGVNSITYYASSIYQSDLGFTPTTAKILAASSQFAIIIGSCICSFTVDRFGRRSLMLFSAAANSVCFAFETGLVSNPNNGGALKGAVFFLFLYYVTYTIGFLGIPFLYASEIAPVQLRGQVCGVSTAVSWLFNFLVAEITPVAFTDIGYRYFIVYCVLNATWVPIIYFFLPETAGRSLEEIDHIFASSKSIWDPVRIAKRLPRRRLAEALAEDTETKTTVLHLEDPERQADTMHLENGEKPGHANGHHGHDPLGIHA